MIYGGVRVGDMFSHLVLRVDNHGYGVNCKHSFDESVGTLLVLVVGKNQDVFSGFNFHCFFNTNPGTLVEFHD